MIPSVNITRDTAEPIRRSLKDRLSSQESYLDESMPSWARRSNPIVRRQLGLYWRVFIPQIETIVRWFAIQSALILLTVQMPLLLAPILMLVLASVIILPMGFYIYFRTLADIVVDSVASITQELEHDTFTLLRTTPITLTHILLSKAAAAFWRRMEDLDSVLLFALYLGLPVITYLQTISWPPDGYPVVSQALIILLFAVSLIRLPLEMFAISMLGVALGSLIRVRSTAIIATGFIVAWYFILINLARFLPLTWPLQLLVEVVLPLGVPLLSIYLSLIIARAALTHD
jgi:hypothetical protein